ncbi:MAG: sulfatase [Actinomycetota bacterium]|nr:sulfatase [Actinomycetota bacterium]
MAGTKPNVLLILIDDLGWSDLGCYGSSFYETPVLDRLAAEGARFTDAYASAPVCSPTRASMLTGRYPARVGVTQYIGGHAVGRLCDVPYFPMLPVQEYSLARALRKDGYQTWHVGKWHLGEEPYWPERHGFMVNVGGCEWGHPLKGYFSPYQIPGLGEGPDGEYLTDRLTDEAIALIEDGPPDAPFFLNYWPYAVHTPIQAPEALVDKYRTKARALGLDAVDPFVEGEVFPIWQKRDQRVVRRQIQSDPTYAAMVENLDWNIGRLLSALEAAGKLDETVVIVTSDNGGLSSAEGSPTSNAPLAEGKGWMYDGGVREPLIVRYPPVVAPGTVVREPVTTPDFYPTILELVGAPPEPAQHVDGVSFAAALGGGEFERGPIFWHYPHYSNQGGEPGASVREGAWKLIRFFDGDRVELYDLESDVSEERDVAARHPEVVARLSALLDAWSVSVGCLVPRENPYDTFDDVPGKR